MSKKLIKDFKIAGITPGNIRERMKLLEEGLKTVPGSMIGDSPEYLAKCPLKHRHADGMYIRELFMPKGMLFVTKIHKLRHPFFILRGDCSILTTAGVIRIKGPYSGITVPGTKRIIYTHKDTVWITVHATKETDLKKIEDEIIAKTYAECEIHTKEEQYAIQ